MKIFNGINEVTVFLISALAVNALPGVDRIVVLNTSVKSGSRGGVMTCLGISLATFIHACVVAFGLYFVLQGNKQALEGIQKLGVAFLTGLALYIILQSFKNETPHAPKRNLRNNFILGFVVHFFNPLAIAFIISFIPQFITSESRFAISFITLSSLSNSMGLTMNLITALAFGKLQCLMKNMLVLKLVKLAGGIAILYIAITKLVEIVYNAG